MSNIEKKNALLMIGLLVAASLLFCGCIPMVRRTAGTISDLENNEGGRELNSFLDSGPNDPSGKGIWRDPKDPNLVTLENGDTIELLGLSVISFTEGPPALALQYETKIKADDTEDLRKQADEIWNVFVEDVESKGLTGAVLAATNTTTRSDGKESRHGYRFVYTQDEKGVWHSADEKK